MPLYEYECDACGRRFERIQKFSDPIVDTCPVCGGAARRMVSSPAIQFKGSGFYITDYPKKGEEKTTKKEDKSGKTTESSSDAKSTETKSTTTETAKPAATSTKDKPKSSS